MKAAEIRKSEFGRVHGPQIQLPHDFYPDIKVAVDGTRWIATSPQLFTCALISGTNGVCFDEIWDYQSYTEAKLAFDIWDGRAGTEPGGWHRHRPSNRRRTKGDPGKEYVRP